MPEWSTEAPGAHPDLDALSAYADGTLGDREHRKVADHLAECEDCFELVAEVMAAQTSTASLGPTAGRVLPLSRNRALRWGSIGAGALAAAALVIFAVRTQWPTREDEGIALLVAAVGVDRTVEGRLSGGFQYGPLRSPSRSAGDTLANNLSLVAAAGAAQQAVRSTPGATNFHAYGIAQLLLGAYDDAITHLQAAANEEPNNPRFLNDLAVAHFERAVRLENASDFPRAFEFAEQAIAIQPEFQEAAFTRALALERLGLQQRAIEAWERYLQLDGTSGWASDARSRLAKLRSVSSPLSRWRNLPQILEANTASLNDLEAMCDEVPDLVPEALLGTILTRWAGETTPESRQAVLVFAKQLSHAFAVAVHDESLSKALDKFDQTVPAKWLAAIRAIGTGFQLLADDRYVDAEPYLAVAVRDLEDHPLLRDWAVFGLARVRYFRGAIQQSETDLNAVIHSARSHRAVALEARALWIRGIVRFTQGRWTESRIDYDDAIRAFDSVRDRQGVATVSVNLSILFRFLGNRELVWQHRMVALQRMPVHRPALAYGFLITTAVTASLEDLSRTALVFLDEALQNASGELPAYQRAETLLQRAKALSRLGQTETAERDLASAEAALQDIHDDSIRKRVLLSLLTASTLIHHVTDPERASDEARRGIANAQERGDLLRSAELHLYLGRALARREQRAEALRVIRNGIDDFRRARASMSTRDPIRLAAFEPVWQLFDEAFALQLQSNTFDPIQAFQAYESSRAQTLLDLRSESSSDLHAVQMRLSDQETLVLLHQQSDSLVAWLIERDSERRVRIPVSNESARRVAGAYLWRLANGANVDDVSRQLHSTVLAPMLKGVAPGRAVIIVPDEPFIGLPWIALKDQTTDEPALTRWSLSIAPSATLAVSAREQRHDTSTTLIVSAPDSDEGMPPLPGARAEGRAIAALYPNAEFLEGADATARAVLQRLTTSRVVHISAHAVNNISFPLLSRLLLSNEPSDLDGLTVRDLFDAPRLTAGSIVVLAACKTIGSTSHRGEGAVGLAWGFLAAGASTVIATLWDVDDAAVSPILVDLHRRLIAGAPPGEALRSAQRVAFERGEPERVWASLELIGLP